MTCYYYEIWCIPKAHSTKIKKYNNVAFLIEKIKFHEHQWVICVDFIIVNFVFGHQGGYTK